MASVRRSIVLATISHYTAQMIGIASTMVLSRLLLPEEVGVYSVGAAVLAIVHVFRDFGVSSYLIREPRLDAAKVGTCLALSLMIAWLSGAILLATIPLIVSAYALPGLRDVLLILTASLFLIPFSSVRLALLRREMRFDVLMKVEIISALANAGVALLLAVQGYSYASLAWGGFAALVATLLVGQYFAVSAPVGRPSLAEWRSVCSFGGMSLALNLIIRIGSQAPMLMVGKLVGMQATGLLSRAMGLSDLLQTIARQTVAPATFAEVSRKLREGHKVDGDYQRAVSYLAVVTIPAALFMMLMARPLLSAMFGANWESAEHLVQIFCLGSLFLPFTIFNGAFLVALGRLDLHLKIEALFSPLKAVAWLLAVPFDLLVAAQVNVALHVLSLATSSVLLGRYITLDWRAMMRGLAGTLPVAIATVIPASLLLAADGLSRFDPFLLLAFAASAGACTWVTSLLATRHPFQVEVRLLASRAWQALGALTRRSP